MAPTDSSSAVTTIFRLILWEMNRNGRSVLSNRRIFIIVISTDSKLMSIKAETTMKKSRLIPRLSQVGPLVKEKPQRNYFNQCLQREDYIESIINLCWQRTQQLFSGRVWVLVNISIYHQLQRTQDNHCQDKVFKMGMRIQFIKLFPKGIWFRKKEQWFLAVDLIKKFLLFPFAWAACWLIAVPGSSSSVFISNLVEEASADFSNPCFWAIV